MTPPASTVRSRALGDRYLARIGFGGTVGRPDRSVLADLVRHHVASIPFENVTSYAPGPSPRGAVSLAPDDVADKMLGAVEGGPRRGGYCFEHAALLRLVLPVLGYTVRPLLGRVFLDPATAPTARTHNVTAVELDGATLLVDPGFGGSTPTAPLDLGLLDAAQDTPHGRYRVVRADDAGIDRATAPDVDVMVQAERDAPDDDAQWQNLYAVGFGAVAPKDIEAFNWYVSTSPRSIFTTRLAAALAPDGHRITISDHVLRDRTRAGLSEHTTTDTASLTAAFDAVAVDAGDALAQVAARLGITDAAPPDAHATR